MAEILGRGALAGLWAGVGLLLGACAAQQSGSGPAPGPEEAAAAPSPASSAAAAAASTAAPASAAAVTAKLAAEAAAHGPPISPTFWEGTACSRLAYIQVEQQGENQTYTMTMSRADGSDTHVIATSSEPLMTPAWSPDGKTIAYTGFVNGASAIYEQPIDGGTRRTISMRPGLNSSPSYSPDGHFMVLTLTHGHAVNLFVMDLRNGDTRQITDSDFVDTEATWSPDGKTIAFTSDRNGPPQVFLVPATGGTAVQLLPGKEQSVHAIYAPDGRSMVFVYVHKRAYRIGRLDLATKELTVETPGRWDENPGLSPDGSHLMWIGGSMTDRTLQQIRLDRDPSPLWVGPSHVAEAAWSGCVFPP